ncbi:MAG: hypothetical protein HFJ32_04335, partial [Clostridia bacterium]|nr:hypothetical protein [Clostridia bacterium]
VVCIKHATTGITLVALVVTIVVLLILAGITLTYVMGDNSVFKQASKAKEETAIAKAREKLELVLTEAKIEKHTDLKYNYNEYLDEMILEKVQGSKVQGDVVISDGYAFILDRSIPWTGEYIGREEELVFPDLSTNVIIVDNKKSANIVIKAKEQENGIKKIEVLQDGIVIQTYNYENRKDEIIETYTVTRNGKYVIRATAALSATKIENVIDLVPSIKYSPDGNDTWKKEHEVRVSTKESIDRIKSIKYQWTDTTVEPAISTFSEVTQSGETITKNGITGKYYLWILVEDNSGNTRIEKSESFWFDNAKPTANMKTEWIEENEKDRLKISISNIMDGHSGINGNSIKMYVMPENGTKQEKEITLVDGEGSIIVDGLNIESITQIDMVLSDNAENKLEMQKKVGRFYISKKGVNKNATPFSACLGAKQTSNPSSGIASSFIETSNHIGSWAGYFADPPAGRAALKCHVVRVETSYGGEATMLLMAPKQANYTVQNPRNYLAY